MVMIITIMMEYRQSSEVHEWLDQNFPHWSYMGSQFHIPPERHKLMSPEDRQALYRAQRETHALTWPRQRVTQHFNLGIEPTDTELVLLKMSWDVIVLTDAATMGVVWAADRHKSWRWNK